MSVIRMGSEMLQKTDCRLFQRKHRYLSVDFRNVEKEKNGLVWFIFILPFFRQGRHLK